MEDAHTTILSLPDDPGTAFFAVYDGHGGQQEWSRVWSFCVYYYDTLFFIIPSDTHTCLMGSVHDRCLSDDYTNEIEKCI